ncbi:hypothetical protein X777_02878 [Ooceraea biroi]|uniref:Uncharacterized protein n=1 Tax=Ooceraea biroi TaxID=2015173 RepID=A0A026WJS8_OOCBI|nr:hypothetical protein X777_02878 [Ooceraea biroi]
MSKFFRKLIFCGCSSRSGLDSRSIVVDESIVDDPPKFAEHSSYEAEPEDLARHFDLSTIKFIDDEEADEDASCTKNGSRRSIRFFFFYRKMSHLSSMKNVKLRLFFRQQPVQSGRIGERRASSPFQNGRTEVLIGEPEGGPRSPRGSTSSAVNDGNFLNLPDERDYPEPICR